VPVAAEDPADSDNEVLGQVATHLPFALEFAAPINPKRSGRMLFMVRPVASAVKDEIRGEVDQRGPAFRTRAGQVGRTIAIGRQRALALLFRSVDVGIGSRVGNQIWPVLADGVVDGVRIADVKGREVQQDDLESL
jgi:hypothetical protein